VGPNRGSSIGVGANFRMRPIMNFPARDSSSAGTSAQSKNSPPKQLSKVSPMVAGHAISRPRIQLTRMDIEAMSAAREQLGQENEVDDNEELNEGLDDHIVEENGEVDVIETSTPPHPGRSRFNLTNIGEENSILLADESRIEESILEESNSTDHVEQLEMLEEERDSTPDISIRRRSRSSHVRVSSDMRRVTRASPEDSSPTRRSVSLGSLPLPRIAVHPPSTTTPTPQARLASAPSTSPQVDILKTQRHPAIVIPDLVQMNHPDLPTRYSQPSSTPFLPTPSPANKRTSAPVFSDFPENPSESFFEQMIDSDPMEGPSWLFAPSTKKRRSSVARRLSTVLSDSERGSSKSTATMNCTTASSMNCSDIDMSNTGDGLSSAEVSGYVLDRDLLETAVVFPSHDSINTSGPVEDNPSSSSVGLSRVSDDDMMDLTSPANKEAEERLNSSNQENAPVGLVGPSSIYESNLSISVSNTPRTPLSSLTYTDPSGEVVKFNPRTDTGVTVARLREARILLDNVGMGDDGATTPYKLSECYIDLSPGRSMSLDQLFSLGLRAGIASPNQSPKVMKRKHVSEMTNNSVTPSKKRRMTDMPSIRQRGVRASLDMIPAPNMGAAAKKRNMVDTSKKSKLPSPPNVYEGLASNSSDDNATPGIDNISDALTGGRTNVVENVDEVSSSIEIVQRKSVEVENVKKMSMIPSFVRLEKSPVKLVGSENETAVVNYESIDMIHCVGGNGKVDATEEIETNVEVPEPERRRRTKVDYAALLNDDVDDRKSKPRRVTEAPSRKASKAVNKMQVEKNSYDSAVLAGESSGLNDDGSDTSDHAKKSVPTVPCPGVESDEEPESMPNSLEPLRGPGNVRSDDVEVDEDESERDDPRKGLISGPPPTEDVSSTSRGSLAAAAPVVSRSSSFGAEDASEGRGGRSRRGNVVSYKEPALGKKLRQGDAGSTSVYTDFKPKAKARKSSKRK